MRLEEYFRDELNYLRSQGREFSQMHPGLAGFLSEPGSDPEVERLLEGFAFLTGSLRAKIEDEFPELTVGLLSVLWENYLRPVPAMTVMQFFPDSAAMAAPMQVTKGCQIDSIPLTAPGSEDDAITCHFQTCRDAWIYPAQISGAASHSGNDRSAVTLDLTLYAGCMLTQLQLDKLCLYAGGGDNRTACELFYWLCARLDHIDIGINGVYEELSQEVVFSGFAPEDALLPYPDKLYSGYRILQEFFCLPQNFLFFHLKNIRYKHKEQQVKHFSLRFCFDRPLPASVRVSAQTFMLNCVPAINLFRHDSEPVLPDGRHTEYPLSARYRYTDSIEIFSVDAVTGRMTGTSVSNGARPARVFQPFAGFRHQTGSAKGRESLYYRLRLRESITGQGFDRLISFVRSNGTPLNSLDEIISATLTCSNGDMPQKLKTGDLCYMQGTESRWLADCRNIMPPTRSLRPLHDSRRHWMLISGMSLNYISLLQRDTLVQILQAYDFPALHDRQAEQASHRRMAGIESITTRPLDWLVKGGPVRGLKSVLSVRQAAFDSEGELYLFGTVLSHFLTLYVSVSGFHQLEMINRDTGEHYKWTAKTGQRAVM